MSIKIEYNRKMCSGKSTACQYLQHVNVQFKILSFADIIKYIANELFDMKHKDRKLLQQIGSKMREIDQDIFVKYLIKKSQKYPYVLVDDVRYPNEIQALQKSGFHLIKLHISPGLQKQRINNLYQNMAHIHLERLQHASEVATDVISNDLYDLIIQVDNENMQESINRYFHKINIT